MAQNGESRGGILYDEMDAATRVRASLQHTVICPNVTGRAKKGVTQSNRAREGLLAADDYPH